MNELTLFADTNLFLQCKDLREIPWKSLDADEITIVIARAVREEIEKLKGDGSSRRSKRARAASRLFREALNAEDSGHVVRESSPRVKLVLARPLPPLRAKRDSLDLDLHDHRLVEEALHWRTQTGAEARVLTDDTDVLLCARDHALRFIEIPEGWQLGPENDPRDKRILALEEQIKALQRTEPQFDLEVRLGGRLVEHIAWEIHDFDTLSAGEIEALVASVTESNPRAEDLKSEPRIRGLGQMLTTSLKLWYPPTDEAINEYQEAYREWQESLHERLRELPSVLNELSRVIPIEIALANTGSCPASQALLEVIAYDGVHIRSARGKAALRLRQRERSLNYEALLPPPPSPPSGKYVSGVYDGRLLGELNAERGFSPAFEALIRSSTVPPVFAQKREPDLFYQQGGRNQLASICKYVCEQFRHGREPERFPLSLVLPLGQKITRSNLLCRVSAANLSRAQEHRVALELTYSQRSTMDVARRWRIEKRSKVDG